MNDAIITYRVDDVAGIRTRSTIWRRIKRWASNIIGRGKRLDNLAADWQAESDHLRRMKPSEGRWDRAVRAEVLSRCAQELMSC